MNTVTDKATRKPAITKTSGARGSPATQDLRWAAVVDRDPAFDGRFVYCVRTTGVQQRVWLALRAIPAGKTASYAQIARRIGAPKSVRAVAAACSANPLAVAIPCHRVVRSDGALSGYRWGVERKRALLIREA